MKTTSAGPESGNKSAARAIPLRAGHARGGDTLGFAWIHGVFHAATYRRQAPLETWTAPAPVQTLEQFEAAVDAAIEALKYGGTDAFIILAHELFVHQMETAPGFNETAARTYLRGRAERHAKEHGESLWVSQRAESGRKDSSYVLHLLPSDFYLKLNEVALRRRLELTRILPLLVPLQLELAGLGEPAGQPVLLAVEAGDATALVVGRTPRDVLFTRTTLASWKSEPARVAVEINRSLLYAKQQFAAAVDRIWIMGLAAEGARAEVEAKCGAGKSVVVQTAGPAHWLDLVAKLSVRHPINLVAGYLRQKRRNRLLRRAVIAACFLGLALLGFETWNREQAWAIERTRLATLAASEQALQAEYERLTVRNAEVERNRAIIHDLVDQRLPAVPPKFIAFLASVLPREARLNEVVVRWDEVNARWTFRAEGNIEADEETARTLVNAMSRQLVRSPLRVRLQAAARTAAINPGPGGTGPVLQSFSLEGGIFED